MDIKKNIYVLLSLLILLPSLNSLIPAKPAYAFSPANMLTYLQAQSISPATGPTAAVDNYERIQYSLDQYGVARLEDGEFPLSQGLVLGDEDLLTSNHASFPVLKLVNPAEYLIKLAGDKAVVSFLTLNYNHQYITGTYPCKSVVQVWGSGNHLNNNHILGGDQPQTANPLSERAFKTVTGIYVMEASARGNVFDNNKVSNSTYGVIFVAGIANTGDASVIQNSEILYNKCDGVTLAGYGEVVGNSIHHNGFDCMNGFLGSPAVPIPGAGIYSIANANGALIQDNTIFDNNGNGIDIFQAQHFVIDGNYSYNPGNRSFPDASSEYHSASYGSGFAIAIADTAYSTVIDNVAENNRSTNQVGSAYYSDAITNRFFAAGGAAAYSDLPSGANQVIAFVLAETNGTADHTVGNVIRNNDFRAGPSGGGAVGLGYFVSRGTGFGQVGSTSDTYWGGDSANIFTLNDPFGSHIGSKRCGGNWYAADLAEPNADDSQHYAPVGDWAGNDFANHY
ncbi:right-handed parallel beta-helix repeat-containing protein [Paenibacillus sp. GCM10027626]|uniref:right-handed parallel beta-helix repeat-containing protein n=1 Tax=Paenibacillus sp. GCM10027626 TaxID=3273411 RepID=UPI0036322622